METFSRLDPAESEKYDLVKRAILKRYELTAEAYRQKFRSSKRQSDETFTEWSVRSAHLLDRWLEMLNITSFEKLKEALVTEQLLESCPGNLRTWLRERTFESLRTDADQYLTVHQEQKRQDVGDSKQKHLPRPAGKPDLRKCFKCGAIGHIARDCSKKDKANLVSENKRWRARSLDRLKEATYYVKGTVDGHPVQMLRDTGCDRTMVHSRFIPDCAYVKGKVYHVTLADGSTRAVSVACVELNWGSNVVEANVGIITTLPEDVLLGNDLAGPEATSYVCVTRQQKRRQEAEERSAIRSMERSQVKPCHIDVTSDRDVTAGAVSKETEVTPGQGPSVSIDSECLSSCDVIEAGVQKTTEDKSEVGSRVTMATPKAEQQQMKDSLTKFEVSELTREQFKLLQLEDKSLDDVRAAVISLNETAKERACFYTREGMLYRKWSPAKEWQGELDTGRQFEQIVVPMKCRSAVLCLANDIPLSGHLGVEKTKDRILKNYYWPGIFKDVANYVKSCDTCQKVARKMARDKVPLVPIPAIGQPFQRVGIDMVGPLPLTKRRN